MSNICLLSKLGYAKIEKGLAEFCPRQAGNAGKAQDHAGPESRLSVHHDGVGQLLLLDHFAQHLVGQVVGSAVDDVLHQHHLDRNLRGRVRGLSDLENWLIVDDRNSTTQVE